MPTDSIIDNVYVFDAETGEKHKLGHIEDIELTASDSQYAESYLKTIFTESLSATFTVSQSLVYQLDVMIGHKFRVPNNWLKRHKIPMNRRKAMAKLARMKQEETDKALDELEKARERNVEEVGE